MQIAFVGFNADGSKDYYEDRKSKLSTLQLFLKTLQYSAESTAKLINDVVNCACTILDWKLAMKVHNSKIVLGEPLNLKELHETV